MSRAPKVEKPDAVFQVPKPRFHYRKPVRGAELVWWLRFLGVAAFVVILLRLPHRDVTLSHIDLRWLGLCMLFAVAQPLVEAMIWQWMLVRQGIRHPYPKTLVAYLAGQYLGLVTPGHVGEFLTAGYISLDTGITFGYALSSVVMKKILGWVVTIGFGVWGAQLVMSMPFRQGVQWMAAGIGLIVVALGVGISIWVFSLRRLARRWERLSPWKIDMTEFWAGMRELVTPRLVIPLIGSATAFSLLFFQLQAVLRALGISLPLVLVAQISSVSRIVGRVIPISLVGFGSKDAAIIGLLSEQGIDLSVGLAATLLLLMCSYLVLLLVSGLCWWIKPLVIPRAAPPSSPGIE